MRKKHYSVILTLALSGFSVTAMSTVMPSVGNLIDERLSYMKDVSGYKAQNHLAIEDLTQEKKVLEKAVADANSLGIEGRTVKHFVQAQMDAAKAIQYRYRADWLSAPEPGWQPRPLDQVRHKISQLSYSILQKVAKRLQSGGRLSGTEQQSFMQDVRQRNLNEKDKQMIWSALNEVSLKKN